MTPNVSKPIANNKKVTSHSSELSRAIKALKNGSFKTWPWEKQQEALKLKNKYGQGFLEVIANNRLLSKLPPEILNEENILIRDAKNHIVDTLLHIAASSEQWQNLPSHILTEKNLCIKDAHEDTPIHNAFEWGCAVNDLLDNPKLLSHKTLLCENSDGHTALELLLDTLVEKEDITKFCRVLPQILLKFPQKLLEKHFVRSVEENRRIPKEIVKIFQRSINNRKIKKALKGNELLLENC